MRFGRALAGSAAVTAMLAVPAGADAAQITLSARCAAANTEVTITGSGFSRDGLIKIAGLDKVEDYALADGQGNFRETLLTPAVTDFRAHPRTLVATDTDNPALTASAPLSLVREFFLTNLPFKGRPNQRVQWLFAGFVPGKRIYGHYVYNGTARRNYFYGFARGACGTLSVRAPRFPTRARRGRWYVQFDQVRKYSRTTKPRRETRVTVS